MVIDSAPNNPARDSRDCDAVRLSRLAFPALAARLDRALEQNGAVGDDRERPDLSRELDERVRVLRTERLAEVQFATLDATSAKRVHHLFDEVQRLFDRVECRVPEPEHFAEAGVDFRRIAELTERDDLQITVAPHGLGARVWQTLVSALGPGLILSNEVRQEFVALDSPPETPTPSVVLAGESVAWTIRGIPSGERPEATGVPFRHGPHPTVAEMLTLQLLRLGEGRRPVDANTFTWLAGPIGAGKLAARHVFDEAANAIRVSARDIGHQGPHLGVRPPVE